MSIESLISRRAVLAAGAGGVGVAALAACGSSSSGSAATSAASTESSSTAAAPSASEDSGSASSSASSSADDSSGSSSAASGDALATLSDIAVGKAVSVKLPGGKPGIVTRTGQNTAKCFSAICTHQGCTVKPAGSTLDCPCHGSQFAAATGKVLSGPAPSPLPEITVSVSGGKVLAAD